MPLTIFALILSFFIPAFASAACPVAGKNHDLLAELLAGADACPKDVLALRALLLADGLKLTPTMVANRGFHNPQAGSFSLFEMAEGQSSASRLALKPGDFFFGHFTEANGDQLSLAQAPAKGALMVELIAWDPAKHAYNFYELVGNGGGSQWFYRGDSLDIAADVKLLHLGADQAKPSFGTRLRCSGCHTNGGPIMKELKAPHNDWWMPDRPLPLGQAPDPIMAKILEDLAPASQLAAAVQAGNERMTKANTHYSLPELLRPLLCPLELNLESAPELSLGRSHTLSVPSGFFVDSHLGRAVLPAPGGEYERSLSKLTFRFPENGFVDADHAWLTPVRAASDSLAIDQLIANGVISERFALAMLSVDFTNPVFSGPRCSLLKFVPEKANDGWQTDFIAALKAQAASNAHAAEAWKNLQDPKRDATWFKKRATNFLTTCAEKLSAGSLDPYLALLAQRRAEAFASPISKNPRGQILEPGFRVIFPLPGIPAVPGRLTLTEACEIEPLTDLGTK